MDGCNGVAQKKERVLTAAQAIIVSLYEASNGDPYECTFSEIEVTLLAWKRSPLQFCIPGYSAYPDRKRVSIMLFNKPCKMLKSGRLSEGPGLLRKWLDRPHKGRFRLSEEGIKEAQRLLGETT